MKGDKWHAENGNSMSILDNLSKSNNNKKNLTKKEKNPKTNPRKTYISNSAAHDICHQAEQHK